MLIKQPNGKYCYVNPSNLTMAINLTKEEYKEMRIAQTIMQVENELHEGNLSPIVDLIKYRKVSDEQLKSMGYEKTYEEMCKYIPKRVVNSRYYGRDCTSYGKCPTCGAPVQDGIGGTDKVCKKCNQVLKW